MHGTFNDLLKGSVREEWNWIKIDMNQFRVHQKSFFSLQYIYKLKLNKDWIEAEFQEFQPRRWNAKNRFQLSADSNLETLNSISSGTNNVWAASQIYLLIQKRLVSTLYKKDVFKDKTEILDINSNRWILRNRIDFIFIRSIKYFEFLPTSPS